MLDKNTQIGSSTGSGTSDTAAMAGELTGSFLDHLSGRSFPYVVGYRCAAGTVQWTARMRLASAWHPVEARPSEAAIRQSPERARTEADVRDAALSAMCGMDLPAALEAAVSARNRRLAVQCLCSALVFATLGAAAWLWETHSFVS